MAVGFRNSAGRDFDLLFNAGTTQAPGFRKAAGTNLAYAPRTSAKIPDVGFREANASDLSNKWQEKSEAPPVPGFNAKNYATSAQAPTGQTGTTRATILLTMRADGSWSITQTRAGSFSNGTTTLDSGTWRPAGSSSGEFTVRFALTGGTGQGTTQNSAPTNMSLSSNQSVGLTVEVAAASAADLFDSRGVTATITRTAGSATTVATCSIACSAVGYL